MWTLQFRVMTSKIAVKLRFICTLFEMLRSNRLYINILKHHFLYRGNLCFVSFFRLWGMLNSASSCQRFSAQDPTIAIVGPLNSCILKKPSCPFMTCVKHKGKPSCQSSLSPVRTNLPVVRQKLRHRLTNKTLQREHSSDYEAWIGLSGRCIWLPTSATMFDKAIILAARLDVPQRCIQMFTGNSFLVTCMKGRHPPGSSQMCSQLWHKHCGVCDDLSKELGHCVKCEVTSCRFCLVRLKCWLCRSDEPGYAATTKREMLLDEAYCEEKPLFPDWDQPVNQKDFDYFPFAQITLADEKEPLHTSKKTNELDQST